MEDYLLDKTLMSHNSWSYLRVNKWWMVPISFMARCQQVDIRMQYYNDVRIFDLRIRFDKDGNLILAHGPIEYLPFDSMTTEELLLNHLLFLSKYNNVSIRVIHELYRDSQHTEQEVQFFRDYCRELVAEYPDIVFFGGGTSHGNYLDYNFNALYPHITPANASSAKGLKKIFGLFPRLYASIYNKIHFHKDNGILLMDYVDVY